MCTPAGTPPTMSYYVRVDRGDTTHSEVQGTHWHLVRVLHVAVSQSTDLRRPCGTTMIERQKSCSVTYTLLQSFFNFLFRAFVLMLHHVYYIYLSSSGPWPGHDSLSVRPDVQENLPDLRLKPHVQHTVSLVQHLVMWQINSTDEQSESAHEVQWQGSNK